MRYLNETDDIPTKIVKVIGDMCGILIYAVSLARCCTPCCIEESGSLELR
jgi:hypothetical protein